MSMVEDVIKLPKPYQNRKSFLQLLTLAAAIITPGIFLSHPGIEMLAS